MKHLVVIILCTLRVLGGVTDSAAENRPCLLLPVIDDPNTWLLPFIRGT